MFADRFGPPQGSPLAVIANDGDASSKGNFAIHGPWMPALQLFVIVRSSLLVS